MSTNTMNNGSDNYSPGAMSQDIGLTKSMAAFLSLVFVVASALVWSTSNAASDLEKALTIETFPPPPGTPSQVLIRNATIWTMEADGIVAGVDLLLKNGKISAYGKDLKASRDALVIDATGMHVTPGIIDAHSHSVTENTGINEGVPSVSSEVRVEDILEPGAKAIYMQLAGGVTTIHILHGSANAIGGQNAIIKLRWDAETPDELKFAGAPPTIKFALGENPKQSRFSGGPGRQARYPKTRMGVAAIIRDSFEQAVQYRDEWQRYESLSRRQQKREIPPRSNLRLDALVEVLEGKRTIHVHAYRADEILMLIRLAEELNFKVGTFQHVLEGYQVADEIAAHGANGSTFSDWWSYKMEAFEAIPYNAALMEERGVVVSLNSDDSNLARRLNLEAAKTIRYGGMAPEQAMAMVTINPAIQLGIQDRVGSLAVGKDADIVIWNGDPLSVFSRVSNTFVDGQLMFSRETDEAHRAVVAAARATLIAEIGGDAKDEEADAGFTVSNPEYAGLEYSYAPAGSLGQVNRPVAIIGATVHPIDAPAIENGIVVFEQGKIVAVGDSSTEVPASAERIDATGKHLWPGIIHANTVLGIHEIDSVAGSVDVAETGDINADIDVSVAIDASSTHFPVARSGGITHAIVVPSGGMVAGTTSLIRTDGWTWEEMTAVRRHSLVLRWPDPVPARYARMLGRGNESLADRKKATREQLEKFDKLLDGARAYGKALADSDQKPEFDPQLDALLPVINGERPLWVSATEKHSIISAVEWVEKRGLRMVLLGGRDAHLVTDILAGKIPVVLTSITSDPPRPDDPYDVLYSIPARLEQAGVLFAMASGTRTGGSSNARQVAGFAGLASGFGLDKEAAYRSITLNPAKILGVDDALGSITPGKSASLVLTDGDILELSTSIEQVWIDGHASSMDDVHKSAYRKWQSRPQPVVSQ